MIPAGLLKFIATGTLVCALASAGATDKIIVASGSWSNPATWGGNLPSNGEKVVVASGMTLDVDMAATVNEITVSQGATLTWSNASVLTINNKFTVDGTVSMNGGNITFGSPGRDFILNGSAHFTWNPGNNTAAGATLFAYGNESFSSTSTLVIKKWYNYSVALGSVVSGDFGNLTLNSLNSINLVAEWNQDNQFQSHRIKGTLTVDQGWITLDKSGSITNTTIGSVVLLSPNSSFYGHNGNHNGAFSINISSVTNNGGNFYGISDGNGNVTVNVSGNFTNAGNVKIINNTGVAGVSNGDVNFTVGGIFSQTSGDTRIIYNVASTNSGTFVSLIHTLQLTGGIFMAQTACHTAGKEAKFEVTGNFTAAFINPSDKFRVASLTSIGATLNNIMVRFKVNGNLVLSGPAPSEFTTSASSGAEINSITGNITMNSGSLNFNYGATTGAHTSTITVGGSIQINGGNTYFSRNSGAATIQVAGALAIAGGNVYIKGDAGTTDFYVNVFSQTSGNLIFHNNPTVATAQAITLIVTGSFTQTAGILNFDSNVLGGAQHVLKINCPTYTIGGTGLITRSGAGVSSVFGLIYFNRGGTVEYYRTSAAHQVQQTKQVVQNATTLDVMAGNVLVSGGLPGTDYFTISTGATVNLRNSQFQSGATSLFSGIRVLEDGTLKLYRTYGLYDGTTLAAINASGNMNYFLDPYSVVEYNGMNNQVVTGTIAGRNSSQHKYGILRINFSGDANSEYVYPVASNVFIRTRLELVQGEFNLNGKAVTLENGGADAVSRNTGYIRSELNASRNTSEFTWQNMVAGDHEFPFGYDAGNYVPVIFSPLSGFGNTVTISTRSTGSDNMPLPYAIAQAVLNQAQQLLTALDSTAVVIDGSDVSKSKVLDRWWEITVSGSEANDMEANVTLSYRGAENSLDPSQVGSTMGVMTWTGIDWSVRQIVGNGTTVGTGTVSIPRLSTFGPIGIMSYISALPIELVSFTARLQGSQVELKWTTATEINCAYYTVERSRDGKAFEAVTKVPAAGNSNVIRHYSATDKQPYPGTSYYRLKQTDFDGKYTYSNIETVYVGGSMTAETFAISSVSPSPFDDSFKVTFESSRSSQVQFILTTATGQLIKEEKIQAEDGTNTYEFRSDRELQKGIYVITLVNGANKVTRKIVKQ